MDWLRSKLGKPAPPPEGPWRVSATLGVQVDITFHTLTTQAGPVECWTYVTEGLAKHGHREVVFCLQRLAGESRYPQDPLALIAHLEDFARGGTLLDPGGRSGFQPGGQLLGHNAVGRVEKDGVVYDSQYGYHAVGRVEKDGVIYDSQYGYHSVGRCEGSNSGAIEDVELSGAALRLLLKKP